MEEERRTLRQRCTDVQSALRSAESSNCRQSAELASCRGQLSAVQCRLEHVEAASAVASRRDGELQTINAALRRDVDHAHQQVRQARPIQNFQKEQIRGLRLAPARSRGEVSRTTPAKLGVWVRSLHKMNSFFSPDTNVASNLAHVLLISLILDLARILRQDTSKPVYLTSQERWS